MTAIETTGSGLIAALEQTWADIRRRTPELPEVVVVTGTGLSSSAFHIDAKWGHFGADHWVEGRPTEEGQGAALDLSAARRRPELFVSGECLAEGPRQTLQTMLHEAVHALAHARGVKDTSRGGKYHNKREFVTLAGELGLAWPVGQRPHPVIGFSEVQLTEQTLADYTDTLAYLGAAIRLYRDTFRRLGLLGGQGDGEGQEGQDGDGQQPPGKTGERFKVACGCQPPRSFWFRRLARAAGLPPIRLHDVRHSYATAALAAGVPAKVVSERLGHANIAITLDVYSHVIPGMDAQAAKAVASLILDGSSPSERPGPKPGPSTDK